MDKHDEKSNKVKPSQKRKATPESKFDEECDVIQAELSIEALDADDSFVNPPVMQKMFGNNMVKNYTRRRGKDAQPGVVRGLKYANKNFCATSLNNKIFFIATGEHARSKHDVKKYGIQPCGLHPYCSNMMRGGEDIAKVYVISPAFHEKYEDTTWACYYHAEASMNGQEVQLQAKDNSTQETPKNSKLSRVAKTAVQDAPLRKKAVQTKTTKRKLTTTAPTTPKVSASLKVPGSTADLEEEKESDEENPARDEK